MTRSTNPLSIIIIIVVVVVKGTSVIKKILMKIHRYQPNCGKMPHLALLTNPFKNSWIPIRRRITSKIT